MVGEAGGVTDAVAAVGDDWATPATAPIRAEQPARKVRAQLIKTGLDMSDSGGIRAIIAKQGRHCGSAVANSHLGGLSDKAEPAVRLLLTARNPVVGRQHL